MKVFRELLVGMLAAITSIIIVMGGISLSLAQGQARPVELSPTLNFPTNPIPSPTTTVTIPRPTIISGFGYQTTATFSTTLASPTSTRKEMVPTKCPPPRDWQQYVVPSGINLYDLARLHGITLNQLMVANCLVSQDLMPDIILYVPPLMPTNDSTLTEQPGISTPEPTFTTLKVTPVPCGQPHSWGIYYVQVGDTLNHLGIIFNTTVTALQLANCLGNNNLIISGQRLYVPNP